MAIWVIDPEAVLAFRRRHRRQVQISRAKKRRDYVMRPRDPRPSQLDKQWLDAVANDKS